MNDRMPTNATSPANQPASSERGIDRLFGELESLYGSRFADLWSGTDIERVKAKWTEKLRGFSDHPGVIQKAVDALDERPSPPTLPEFIQLCRDAARRFGTGTATLPHHPSPEERERAKAAASEAARIARGDSRDHLAWAREPKSQCACTAVFDGAKRDSRLRDIRDELIRSGIADESGKLLRRTYS